TADFTATMQQAMRKETNDVTLRVWTPVGATVTLVQQVSPAIEDLTGRRTDVSDLEGDYPTGAWGEESREYHLAIRVPPRGVGDRMLAARCKLIVGDETTAEARIEVVWTDDEAKSTLINGEVAHYTGQEAVAVAIDEAFAARRAGDDEMT